MQYFRNNPRRMQELQNPHPSDIFPLCRNDREDRTSGIGDRGSLCGCERNAHIAEPTHTQSHGTCGCGGHEHMAENSRLARPESCGCNKCEAIPDGNRAESYGCTGLAMAFVPEQEFIELYEVDAAFCAGSLFRQLDMPFYGQRRRSQK